MYEREKINNVKNKINQLLFLLINPFFELVFTLALCQKKNSKIWLVDIDNTIADSANFSSNKKISNFKKLKELTVLKGSQKLITELTDTTVIYLTARNYIYYFSTKTWLKNNNFLNSPFNLILVLHPKQKLFYLKKIAYLYDVTYIDDLSFNHETGIIEFYSDLIEDIKKLPIVYYDYDYIKSLNH